MNGFSDWFDNNWVDLARLFVQCGILTAIVWYSRNILKTLRASQEQIGALLRLSVSEGAAHEHASSIAEPALAPPGFTAPASLEVPRHEAAKNDASHYDGAPSVSPAYGFSLHASAASHVPEREQSLGGRVATERAAIGEPEAPRADAPAPTPWVAAPVTHEAEPVEGLAARMADSRRNLGRWLKEPACRTSTRVNPFRKMLRWLQAPAGH